MQLTFREYCSAKPASHGSTYKLKTKSARCKIELSKVSALLDVYYIQAVCSWLFENSAGRDGTINIYVCVRAGMCPHACVCARVYTNNLVEILKSQNAT